MRVDAFDFQLPEALIAQTAAEPRDSARLLHVGAGLHDAVVRDLPALLQPGDIMVFNNSRVIPARLFCDVGGKQVEVLLHQPLIDDGDSSDSSRESAMSPRSGVQASTVCARLEQLNTWQAFARPAKKLKEGMQLCFGEGFEATVQGRTPDGQVLLAFVDAGAVFFEKLHRFGHMPLPPYIARPDTPEDASRYQTIYAKPEGSVAAPTAGLHFTEALFAALDARGVKRVFVTLHVGAGTFQPVKVEDTSAHQMHSEWGEISAEVAAEIAAARAAGGKVVAVGTTSVRVLETAAASGTLGAWSGQTDIFITPGYQLRVVDRLLTNFHLPKSTLFMLVSAFSGLERMQAAYAHAIAKKYRFYSYGDACLLERA
jgi:S-adenosylmethionine:tRNA ribosyltransferase-isomerase